MFTMKICVIHLFLLSFSFVLSTTIEDYLQSIDELLQEEQFYTFPENYNEFRPKINTNADSFGTYDFIIVGGGTAGTLLANRLSEVQNWSILLLEAGQNETSFTDIPYYSLKSTFSHFNWGFKTIPQTNCCLGMKNNQCIISRGKGLGGSTILSYLLDTRGNREDYDKWEADGNQGWSYNDVFPYFLKFENSSLNNNVDEEYHSSKGELHVEHVRFGVVFQNFLDGNMELGYKILDYNGKSQMGASRAQTNTINGRRCSANKAFLKPVVQRKNLKIVTGAYVTKVYIEKNVDNAVVGVEFYLKNKKYYAENTKEVILSAGVINTPQILMLSGVGPQEHLKSLSINVVKDLPVGQNLHDHVLFLNPVYVRPANTGFSGSPRDYSDRYWLQRFFNNTGFYTAANDIQGLHFYNSFNKSETYPNLEELVIAFSYFDDDVFQNMYNFNNETYNEYIGPYKPYNCLIGQVLLHPKSRGSIKLKSSNAFDHPLIDVNYFSNSTDIKPLIRGYKHFLLLIDTKPMKQLNLSLYNNILSKCPQEYQSDDYIRCLIPHVSVSMNDLAGTCKMGPISDSTSVVDSNLKVHGVRNLRVIDASVIPFPLSGHINTPTYLIAEKGSDIIKNLWL